MWNRLAAAAAATLTLVLAGPAGAEDLDRAFSDTAAHTLTSQQAPRWAEVQQRARQGSVFSASKASKTSKTCKPAPLEKGGKVVHTAKASSACAGLDLKAVVNSVRDASTSDQMKAVDRAVNALPYVSDTRNWGVADYWETPQEMLARGGDCEGFALTKYFALRHLGVRDDAMRIAIVWDRRDLEEHAVLLVRTDDEVWILDNKTAEPVRLSDDAHRYNLIYSLNEAGVRLPAPIRTSDRSPPRSRIVNDGRTLVINVRRSGRSAAA